MSLSFGAIIKKKRLEKEMSQKELADKVKISPQYLNDIEHERRNPPPEKLLKKIAKELELDFYYLSYIAGIIPEEIKDLSLPEDEVVKTMKAFRKTETEYLDEDGA